ncbi:MAG: DnaD domain protein [Clostridiales bacterium]|nr:DnaD domain protein [Clostridiales bacterium]
MTTEEKNKLLLSDTQVPDLFITQYMSSLTGSSIQIYLLMLLHRSQAKLAMTVDRLAQKIGMAKSDLEEQLFYLVQAGLVERFEDGTIQMVDIKAKEVDRYIEAQKGEDLDLPPQHADPRLSSLSRSISDTFFMGSMSYVWQRFIDDSAKVHKLDPDVIYSLFGTLQEKGKLLVKNTRPAEELRENWCKRGVKTSSDLDKIMQQEKEVNECVASMGKKTRKSLDGVAIEYITTWITTYKMKPDVPPFLYTYLRKDKNREKVSFPEMDEILQEWFSHNIHDVESAKAYEMRKEASDRTHAMTQFCGELFRKKLDGMDLAIIEKWANEDRWEEPIVRYAYEVLHKYMTTITLQNVDDRLSLWKDNEIASVTKAKQFEAEAKRKNQETYALRHTREAAGSGSELPYLQNDYTQEQIDGLESDPLKDMEDLLNEKTGGTGS